MEPQQPKIEIPLPDSDVEKVERHLESRLSLESLDAHAEKAVRESIKAAGEPTKQKEHPEAGEPALDVLPDYTDKYSEEAKTKIENLLQIAADKGLDEANRQAEDEPPYILDAFHDALAEKLLPYLKQKGIIK